MKQHELEVAIRIEALEIVVRMVAQVAYGAARMTEPGMHALHEAMREALANRPLPGFDAAESDHVSAELEGHVSRLLRAIEETRMRSLREGQ